MAPPHAAASVVSVAATEYVDDAGVSSFNMPGAFTVNVSTQSGYVVASVDTTTRGVSVGVAVAERSRRTIRRHGDR